MKLVTAVLIALSVLASPALAQMQGGGQGVSKIKSLTERELAGLENGLGMGMGRLGELNRYPGPRHVLELATELQLTDEQKATTQALYDDMRSNAIRTGREIIEAEAALDKAFAENAVDDESLQEALTQIGLLRARLRYVHLEAHMRQRALLTESQVAAYDKLRARTRGGPGQRMQGQGQGKGKKTGRGQGQGDCARPCNDPGQGQGQRRGQNSQ